MTKLRCTAALMVLLLAAAPVLSCTTFCLRGGGEVLFGKNYDWMIGDGMVFVNKRGVAKISADPEEKNPASWTSRYGSVTFNQYGWESPSGGMNEAGLVIELMWLDETQWPAADARPTVDVLEWIQYNLDIAATVTEVIANAEKIRVESQVKLHYLVSDRSGNAATIEYLNGKLVAHTGKDLPIHALANDSYARSVNYARSAANAASESSFDRFTRAGARAREFAKKPHTEKEAVDYAFETLGDVAQKGSTQWSIVYDQKRAKVHFRTRKSPEVKTIRADAFDYSCGKALKVLDVDSGATGDVTSAFANYTRAANRDLIERSFSGTPFLQGVPATERDQIAAFPERFGCGTVRSVLEDEPLPMKDSSASAFPAAIFIPALLAFRYFTRG
jgi:penicillin V acylase-like amidase (Ntn superfamily)